VSEGAAEPLEHAFDARAIARATAAQCGSLRDPAHTLFRFRGLVQKKTRASPE
jgi:hypothetical protein